MEWTSWWERHTPSTPKVVLVKYRSREDVQRPLQEGLLILTYRLPPHLVRYVVVDIMQPYLFLKYYYFSLLLVGKMENVLHFKT